MGIIHEEVRKEIRSRYPEQFDMLKPFLSGFDVTYGEKIKLNNTVLFTYLLKPEAFIKHGYGIEKEMLLAYSQYDELQARAIQAVNMLFDRFPYRNRIDTLNCFFVSKDTKVMEYRGVTAFGKGSSRVIVPLVYAELIQHKDDVWYLRNQLKNNFFDVDLFGYTLPLKDEASFFGRQQIVSRYIDAIKRCENRGVFGVRKTGKTSLLFKIDRIVREQHLGFVFYYDCKSPSYRKFHWNELLGEICDNIAKRLKIKIRRNYDEKNIIKSFRYVMKEASIRNKKVVIIFDEIEYISFRSPLDPHWKLEYIEFWQTMWSVQSLHRNLVFIISGVNASVTEVDMINGVQNPLFGIVQSEYLQGLSSEETHMMIKTLGKRMGLKFSYDTIEFLFKQYNGHPMLTRLACSYIGRQFSDDLRPVDISLDVVKKMQEDIDIDLAYYFKHIVSEIQQFYPDEYEMFELLASGQTSDFVELSTLSDFVKHLYSYGLVDKNEYNIPYVKMPVAGRYVALELAKRENRKTLFKIIKPEDREQWVRQRIKSIIRDMRLLETAINSENLPKLFGENSFPEAEKFAAILPVTNKIEFDNFFNVCNRCFVEPIENYGRSIGKKNYFWNEIKSNYKALFGTLHRIKIYRHSADHLQLQPRIAQQYQKYWKEDTENIADTDECYFCIQQKLLESFLTNLQIEMGEIT